MVESLCTNYGLPICSLDGKVLHAFPTLNSLTSDTAALEKRLRGLSFGYRAAYIAKAAASLQDEGGEDYLRSLRKLDYDCGREALLRLNGVGPKVADCVLLMSLDKASAIPVDTHMFQIAAKRYLPHLRGQKTVTERAYREVAAHFRDLYGEHAGWAHSVGREATSGGIHVVEANDIIIITFASL